MKVRCKFKLTQIHLLDWGGKKLIFDAVYDNSIPEDQRFCKATPSGRLEQTIAANDVANSFELGKYYYFDASPVPEAVAA